MIEVVHHNNSEVTIDREAQIVTKKYDPKISDFYIRREAKWIRRCGKHDIAPRLLKFSDRVIVMTYVGEAITSETLPSDWEKQLHHIANKLVRVRCFYLDLQLVHLRVLDGKIRLIDFGQTRKANPSRQWIPELIRERMLNIVRPLVS